LSRSIIVWLGILQFIQVYEGYGHGPVTEAGENLHEIFMAISGFVEFPEVLFGSDMDLHIRSPLDCFGISENMKFFYFVQFVCDTSGCEDLRR